MNLQHLKNLIEIDSPTGYTQQACEYIFKTLKGMGLKPHYTNKGAVVCPLGQGPTLAIAAHVDTLGAIVSGTTSDGLLRISPIGGLNLNDYEAEYCRIHTLSGVTYTGTFLLDNPSTHANAKYSSTERKMENMHIRLDEDVQNKANVKSLGINNGDFVSFYTHYEETPKGFIKSRYMDNKAGCFVLLEIARYFAEQQKEIPVELFFSNYEEVGHGGTVGYSKTIEELLVIDMGVVGDACEGTEQHCSICAKDSSGPYDYNFRKKLVDLATKNNIPYKLDVYPYYGSDGSAALRAGNDFRVALIGPGVAASHGKERTHVRGIKATVDLCLAYVNTL